MKAKWVCLLLMLGAILAFPARSQAIPVDLELVLLVDVSGSIDAGEFDLQRTGYANAFLDPSLAALIQASGVNHQIACTLVYWSSAGSQQQALPWTLISDGPSASAFGTAVGAAARPFSGNTAPGSAINFAVPLFNNNFEGLREVIDVSGDGAQNEGASTPAARDNAILAGVYQLNGLAIEGSEAGLLQWYINNIQAGPDSFTLSVTGFDTFEAGVKEKLFREVVGVVPEPVTVATLLLGIGCLSRYARRRLA